MLLSSVCIKQQVKVLLGFWLCVYKKMLHVKTELLVYVLCVCVHLNIIFCINLIIKQQMHLHKITH